MTDIASLEKLKVSELKEKLAEKGLPTNGKKAELVKRLNDALLEGNHEKEEEVDVTEDIEEIGNDQKVEVQTQEVKPSNGEKIKAIPDQDKKQERAKRFGIELVTSDADKKKMRSERFKDSPLLQQSQVKHIKICDLS